MKIYLILAVSIIFSISIAKANLCEDFLVWDGSEPVQYYGVDSTGYWWAITSPFTGISRLIVNGKQSREFTRIYPPIFSPNGERWATFGEISGSWFVVTNDDMIELKATRNGSIGFSSDSRTLVYSYFQTDMEYIVVGRRTVQVVGKVGTFFTNLNGSLFAFIGIRGNRKIANINGMETTTYDDIIPIGFWHDNTFMYAAKNGNTWQFYRNRQAVSNNFNDVKEVAINIEGTVAAALVTLTNGFQTGVTFSDEYYEPLFGRNYDAVSHLQLHPELALVAYFARTGVASNIVLNTAEFSTQVNTGLPFFSSDGEDLAFASCEFDCFININGRRFPIRTNIDPQIRFAIKPKSNTIAYSTASNMVVLFLENQRMHSGMMVDRLIPPVFNRKANRYEALGEINNRLYLLTCRTN